MKSTKYQTTFNNSRETLALIKAVMKDRQISIVTVAKAIGIPPVILSDQLYFRRPIREKEIKMILKYLKIPVEIESLSSIDKALGELGYIRAAKDSNNVIESIYAWYRWDNESE